MARNRSNRQSKARERSSRSRPIGPRHLIAHWFRGSRLAWAGVLVFVLAVVGISAVAAGLLGDSGKGTALAEAAPDITLATEAGDYQLSKQQGKVVVLYFSQSG